MELLGLHIDRSYRRNRQRPAVSAALLVKVQTFRECFPGKALPPPSAKVNAAWNDLPNIIVDDLAKTRKAFLRVPPITSARPALDADVPPSSDTSSSESLDDDHNWTLVDDPASATSDEEHLSLGSPAIWEGDLARSEPSCPNRPPNEQIHDQASSRSPTNNSSSSDEESLSSSGGGSPIQVGFDNMVNQWLVDYRGRGTEAFIESLIAYAVISVGAARQASRIARAVVRKLSKLSYTEGKNLENAIRSAALGAFKNCWRSDDTSTEESSTPAHPAPPTPHGINIASLIGGLFDQKLSTAKDIHLCLSLLLEGEKRFDCLCAMHALLIQANDKLCKNRNLRALMQFRDGITSIGKESRQYLWVTGPHSKMILTDILALIERWTASQAIKREESQIYAGTSHRTIRNSAVGPRLRTCNDPVV